MCECLFYAFPHSESFICLSDNSFEMKLWEIIPRQKQVFDWKTCKNVADFFAQYIGYDSINVQKIYLAGALHDIGKMAVGNEILEKTREMLDDMTQKGFVDSDISKKIRECFWWNLLIIRRYLHRKFNIRNLYINLMNLWNITMMR